MYSSKDLEELLKRIEEIYMTKENDLDYAKAIAMIENHYTKIKKKEMVLKTARVIYTFSSLEDVYIPCVADKKYVNDFDNWTIYIENFNDVTDHYIIGHLPSYAQVVLPKESIKIFQNNGFEFVKINYQTKQITYSKKIMEGHCKVLK